MNTEYRALTSLAGRFPVPEVVSQEPGVLVTGFVDGRHGQDLIDLGYARQVLQECGRVLRQLHSLDARLLDQHAAGDTVIQHGDFGPNNVLLNIGPLQVAAVLDWEFSRAGHAITDVAWCEWIVRMHHPDAVGALGDFFNAYGAEPAWHERQEEMLRRCRVLGEFSRRWDPEGNGVRVWQERAEIVSAWTG
jgi:aminoglycoside phosphotransferase (APT) family kinase protein